MITAKRRKLARKIVKKRLKQIHLFEKRIIRREEEQPNRLVKTKPFSCHRSKCKICHPVKDYLRQKRSKMEQYENEI